MDDFSNLWELLKNVGYNNWMILSILRHYSKLVSEISLHL
jgi:hypothetical protein